MKLFRYGPQGAEKPGLLDAGGVLRDLSGVVPDVGPATLAPDSMSRLSALDPARAGQAVATLVDQARARGATLVATLHQVDRALAHFPRIVGLREGRLVFDLPPGEVTPERLAQLYAQHEHELVGPAAVGAPVALGHAGGGGPAPAPAPAVMHCR